MRAEAGIAAPRAAVPPSVQARAPAFALALAALVVLTVVALVVGNGSVAIALVPTLLFGVLYAMATLPLRYSVLTLMFAALTLENPADVPGAGLWRSPLYPVGALLLAHMNVTLPVKGLLFSGLDVALVYLLAIAVHRRATGSAIDDGGRVESARPASSAATACLVAALAVWVHGIVRGGADVGSSLWQVQRVVYLPVVFFLCQLALRGPRDAAAVGKVVLAAACVKACLAMYVRATVPPPPDEPVIPYATTHADSMLFALSFCMVVALALSNASRRRPLASLAALALLSAGMVANNRRIVWVELAAGLAAVYAVSPATRLKRTLARAAAASLPLVLAYLAVGWEAGSSVFRPVQIARSVIDSDSNGSTAWRDWENYDLVYTIRQSPIFGSGYGHGFVELVKLPEISGAYSLYRFIPHNSILSLWAFGGIFGFAALFSMMTVAVFLAVRTHARAGRPEERAAALAVLAAVVVYLVHCYGDMGLGTWTAVWTLAPALALIAKMAVAVGAWPSNANATLAPGERGKVSS